MDIKTLILNELDDIEALATRVRTAPKQNDAEVADLKKQVRKLDESNKSAREKIDGALGVLKALK